MQAFRDFAARNAIRLEFRRIEKRATHAESFKSENDRVPEPVHFDCKLIIGEAKPCTLWAGEYSVGVGIAESWAKKNKSKFHLASLSGRGFDVYSALAKPLPPNRYYGADSPYWEGIRAGYAKHAGPEVADVLHCLQMDSANADQPFSDWAEDYGYSSDSISAKAIWESCNETRRALQRGLRHTLWAEFLELEE
jgi:hypothetical protein